MSTSSQKELPANPVQHKRLVFYCDHLLQFCRKFNATPIECQTSTILEVKLKDLQSRWRKVEASYEELMLSPDREVKPEFKNTAKINFEACTEAYYRCTSKITNSMRTLRFETAKPHGFGSSPFPLPLQTSALKTRFEDKSVDVDYQISLFETSSVTEDSVSTRRTKSSLSDSLATRNTLELHASDLPNYVSQETESLVCKFCKENHSLKTCSKFQVFTIQQRVDFIYKNKFGNNTLQYNIILQEYITLNNIEKTLFIRQAPIIKGYAFVYICFNTKAIRLQPCSNRSSSTSQVTFFQFVGGRGLPQRVVTDTALSEDITEITTPTSGLFIKAAPILCFPEHEIRNISTKNKLENLKALYHNFSLRRKEDYLKSRYKRHKWRDKSRNVQFGDLAVILDDRLTPRVET